MPLPPSHFFFDGTFNVYRNSFHPPFSFDCQRCGLRCTIYCWCRVKLSKCLTGSLILGVNPCGFGIVGLPRWSFPLLEDFCNSNLKSAFGNTGITTLYVKSDVVPWAFVLPVETHLSAPKNITTASSNGKPSCVTVTNHLTRLGNCFTRSRNN